jgi:hypothetical protein
MEDVLQKLAAEAQKAGAVDAMQNAYEAIGMWSHI